MRRCVHDRLDRAGEFANRLGVERSLIELNNHFRKENDNRIEAEQNQRQVEQHRPERIHRSEAVGDRNVEKR